MNERCLKWREYHVLIGWPSGLKSILRRVLEKSPPSVFNQREKVVPLFTILNLISPTSLRALDLFDDSYNFREQRMARLEACDLGGRILSAMLF